MTPEQRQAHKCCAEAAPGAEFRGPLRRVEETVTRQQRLAFEQEFSAGESHFRALPRPVPDLCPGVEVEC